MANFPKLTTGAVMQYPAASTMQFESRVMRFVDGSEQRFRATAGALRRWSIQLALLNDSELAELDLFCKSNQGTYGTFSFTDPWDGTEYPSCSLEGGRIEMKLIAEGRSSTSVVIRENRA